MPYLIAKISILLLLAAALGAWLASWALRRRWQDVSSEYESLRSDWRSWRTQVDQRLAAPPATVDLSPVQQQLAAVETALRAIEIPKPQPTDLRPVLDALAALPRPAAPDMRPVLDAVAAIPVPVATDLRPILDALAVIPRPAPVDLRPVLDAVAAIPVPAATNLRPVLDAVAAIRIPQPQPVDLSPLEARLAKLETQLRELRLPPPVDLAPLVARVEGMRASLAALRIPEPPPAADLASVLAGLQALHSRVEAIERPAVPAAPDLAPIERGVQEIDRRLGALRIPEPVAVDLAPLETRLSAVQAALERIVIPPPREPDLTDVLAQLGALDQSVNALTAAQQAAAQQAAAQPVDLGPVQERLGALEAAVNRIPIPPPQAVDLTPAPEAPHPMVRKGSRNLLSHAAYGKADDLKRIKGVAEVLERMLHRIGVYYFWQIAEWTTADVAHVDAQLTAFRGRIARDAWIAQSRDLMRAPGSAAKPQPA